MVMLIPGRRLLLTLSAIITATGVALLLFKDANWLAWVVVAGGVANVAALALLEGPRAIAPAGKPESDDIHSIDPDRIRELVRGTSKYLADMNYRYSIRLNPTESSDHRSFTAEVNTVKLGFVPVIITDNTNDRQGHGFVAFVHDGKRWRGPGLPCPNGQVEAVRHAAKCVSPLAKEEETKF